MDVVEAYRTVVPEDLACRVRASLAQRPIASPSPVPPPCAILVEVAGIEALRGIPVASIGPITTQTARELGLTVATQASIFTVEGLVQAVLGLYTE